MNKQQFEELSAASRELATESYFDGFEAAIAVVQSLTVRVGDDTVDQMFISNRNTVVSALQAVLKRMQNE